MTWLILTHALAIAVGAFCGWAAARVKVRDREASRLDLAAELRSPVDLEPSEFSHDWAVRG